ILKNCSATSGTFPSGYQSYYSIFDFLANHLASVEPTIRSSGDDVLPNVYCGIATLLLVPLYLFTKSVPLKEKVASVGLLGIIYFSFNVNFLNYIWHGFHFPNDLPYRFSFMYSFVLLTLAYKAFVRLNEFTGKEILGTGVAVVFGIIMIQEIGSKNVEEITVLISLIFVVTYCLVFALMKNEKYQKSAVAVLLLCCVIGEIACSNTDRYSMDQPKTNYVGDYDEFVSLKEQLDEYNGSDMYRMDLTYNRARMDPAWYGYHGVSTFSSMAYEKMANVQSDLGVYGNYINSYTYYLQTPVYNMMHSLKYIVDNNTDVTLESDYYSELMGEGKFTAYENEYYLPVGMAVNNEIKEWYTDFNNPFTVQSDWFEYSTGVADVFSMMTIDNIHYYNMDEITSGLDTGDIYFTKSGSGEGELTFILKVPETKHCYLYVNSSSFDSIEIGKYGEVYTQHTDEPYIYDLGILNPDDEISVLIKVEDDEYGYIDFYPYYVNDEALIKGYNILAQNSLNVTSFEETKITGTVSAAEDCVFYSSIPYDTGWTVKIDGKKIAEEDYINLAEAYLCFNLPAGEHEIEISFMQDGLLLGAGVSAATVILLIAAAVFFARKRKKQPVYALPAAPVVLTDDDIITEVDMQLDEAEEAADEEQHIAEEETADETAEATEEIESENISQESEGSPEEENAVESEEESE
ncbi:MAG: YfhO family protein, partial [Clostridia bacterium]|nr:YfhO family protein [Clostridia bacterium]